ncbi:hypothetical protein LZ31DRAFT_331112 [Colletotrichum somersetense]|nr:hypothetical protein LZ31DRAFT_331112 [Colletotrichum somersetense]
MNNYHREPTLQGLAEAPHQRRILPWPPWFNITLTQSPVQHRKSTNTTPSQMVLSSIAALSRHAVSLSRPLARSSDLHPPFNLAGPRSDRISLGKRREPFFHFRITPQAITSVSLPACLPVPLSVRLSTLAMNRAPSRLTRPMWPLRLRPT